MEPISKDAWMLDKISNLSSEVYIDNLELSTTSLINYFQSLHLDVCYKPRDRFVEMSRIPSLVLVFYYYIYSERSVPTQQQFISSYIKINEAWIQKFLPDHLLALKGRLSRTYPSLLRDIYFYTLLRESGYFSKVVYKVKYDLEAKIDVSVSTTQNWYGLQLRVSTYNSDMFYKLKPFRDRYIAPEITSIIDMPLDLSNARIVYTKKDSLKLYSHDDVNKLIQYVSAFEKVQIIE